nr:MAG TPA: hypothetical protein [Caudoviricetes sp.]
MIVHKFITIFFDTKTQKKKEDANHHGQRPRSFTD